MYSSTCVPHAQTMKSNSLSPFSLFLGYARPTNCCSLSCVQVPNGGASVAGRSGGEKRGLSGGRRRARRPARVQSVCQWPRRSEHPEGADFLLARVVIDLVVISPPRYEVPATLVDIKYKLNMVSQIVYEHSCICLRPVCKGTCDRDHFQFSV